MQPLLLLLTVVFLSTVADGFLFPSLGGGGGGCCCQQQQSCCCQQTTTCCTQTCCQPQPSCGCGGGGYDGGYGNGGGFGGLGGLGGFGRKKREIGQKDNIRGYVSGVDTSGSYEGQCNSVEIAKIIRKNLEQSSSAAAKSAIFQELDALYPEESFTVFCVDGSVSYQADANKYCVEGNMRHNCYVFLT